jgi:hypothetical protein
MKTRKRGGDIFDYTKLWDKYVSKELFKSVYFYYCHVDFVFLVDKVERELNQGNAGGPQVRSRFPAKISSKVLAESSIHGLNVLLTIKTFECIFPFTEKTRITDDSMLTDLAWHSLMLKPHKYYIITNAIMEIIYKHLNRKYFFYFDMDKEIQRALLMVNREVVKSPLIVSDDEPKYVRLFNSVLKDNRVVPVLVRHGTDKEIKIEIDIRDFIKNIEGEYEFDADIEGPEWNMPLPLFP